MPMNNDRLKHIIEAALLAAARPLSVDQLERLFDRERIKPSREDIRAGLEALKTACEGRGYELMQVAGGYRFQVRQELEPWISRLWEDKPPRYSRALLEILALIVYRQPITRSEIEEIRGVSVSTHIIKTLLEREWVRVLGHKEVPGRPAMYGSTRKFLDDFNLKSLDDLPSLAEIKDFDQINPQFDLGDPEAHSRAQEGGSTAIVTPLPMPLPGSEAEH